MGHAPYELGYRKWVEELHFYKFLCTFLSVALEQNIGLGWFVSHFVGNLSGYIFAKFQICTTYTFVTIAL